jgi:tetratricopeptide (TPR) repeat protein/serine/threonine protein kinase
MNHAAAVEAILFSALELGSAAERATYLDTACAGDVELRRQVEKLLKAHANVGDFLLKPVGALLAAAPEPPDEPNQTTDHSPGGQASTEHPAGNAPDKGLPVLLGYRVLREIARGGMGRVLAARDLALDRDLALKVLLPGANPARFVRESKITARLPHPGIPPVHALGTLADGSPFLAMKLIAGQTLAVEMKTADRPRLLQVFLQVCQAVGFAHSKGVVHRDLKPANIMVGAFGEVQVMDWGLAKDLDRWDEPGAATTPATAPAVSHADTEPEQTTAHPGTGESSDDQTQAGTVMGTPAYMAPEQARGEAAAARSDVFALGGILCTILTGKAPYRGKSTAEVIRRAAAADLAETYARLDGCGADAELVALCRVCLSRNPADRPVDGQAVAHGMTAYLNGVQERLQTAQREQAVALTRQTEERKRRKWQLALAAAVVLAVLGVTAGAGIYLMNAVQRDATERERRGRNAGAVALLLQEGVVALQAGDTLRAKVVLDAAEKRAVEGGADESSARLGELREALNGLIDLDENDQITWTIVGESLPNEKDDLARLSAVLARFGLNPNSPPEEASARVKDSAVRDRLVAALDFWMFLEQLPTRQDWVRAVLKGADPHPYRDAVRDALLSCVRSPSSAAVEKLSELLSQPQASEQPPGFVTVMGMIELIPVEQRREMLKSALRHDPRNLAILMAMGSSYPDGKANAAEQVRWFTAAVTAAPGNSAAHYNLGLALKDQGDLEGAIAHYRKASEFNQKFAGAHTSLGKALWNKGDLDGAIVHYRKAIEIHREYAPLHYNLGNVLRKKGDLDGAIASYREAVKLDPKHAKAYTNLGLALRGKGDLNGAITSYREAVKLDPQLVEVRTNLGQALHEKGDLDEALEHLHEAVKLAPRALPYTNLGVVQRAKGDLNGAIASFRKAIEVDPRYVAAHFNLGLALRAKGDLNGAIDHLRESVNLDPTAIGHDWLGFVLRARGDLNEAIAHFRQAIQLDPKYGTAHSNLGIALFVRDDLDEAIDPLRKAIELRPKDATPLTYLGRVLWEKGDLDGAIDHLRKAITLNPKNAVPLTYLSLVQMDQGDLPGGIGSAREAVKLAPKNAWVHDTLGYLLMARGDLDEASDCFRKAISLNPKYRMASTNLARAERFAPVQGKLPALLKGDFQPQTNDERLALAELCNLRRLYRTAAGLYGNAFAADPKVAADLKASHRYYAACSAALAGTGQGADAGKLDDQEKGRLRQQSLDCLRADLVLRTRQLESGTPADRADLRQKLTRWQNNRDLAGIRAADALAQLPADERAACERLWADVAALLEQAKTPAPKEDGR